MLCIFALCGLKLKISNKNSKSNVKILITLPGLPFLTKGGYENFRFRIFAKSAGENIQKWQKSTKILCKN